jgi:hypothetical protein
VGGEGLVGAGAEKPLWLAAKFARERLLEFVDRKYGIIGSEQAIFRAVKQCGERDFPALEQAQWLKPRIAVCVVLSSNRRHRSDSRKRVEARGLSHVAECKDPVNTRENFGEFLRQGRRLARMDMRIGNKAEGAPGERFRLQHGLGPFF